MAEKIKVMGIDPGFRGSIVSLYDNRDGRWGQYGGFKLHRVQDMPVDKFKGKPRLRIDRLIQLIEREADELRGVVVEAVNAAPGQGVASMFRFGYQAGVIDGVLHALNIPFIKVNPAVWKSSLNLSRDKKASIKYALTIFPDPTDQSVFKTHRADMAEAAILATLYPQTKKP